jgi:hypothetical protein
MPKVSASPGFDGCSHHVGSDFYGSSHEISRRHPAEPGITGLLD